MNLFPSVFESISYYLLKGCTVSNVSSYCLTSTSLVEFYRFLRLAVGVIFVKFSDSHIPEWGRMPCTGFHYTHLR